MSVTGLLAIWKPLAIAGCAGLVIGSGCTWRVRDMMEAESRLAASRAQTRDAKKVIAKTQTAAKITESVGAKTEASQARTRIIYRDIIREVPVYVSPETDRRYPLPVGFVRVLDAAAGQTTVPDGPRQSDDDPSAVTASVAAGVLTDWAGMYYACRAQVAGWNDWHAEQRKAWESK
jgi:hypothetical protein